MSKINMNKENTKRRTREWAETGWKEGVEGGRKSWRGSFAHRWRARARQQTTKTLK